jgi:hypothetical protein
MDAPVDLAHALAEWRRLTHLEGEAILSDNWQGIAEHQARKAQLEGEIQHALALVRSAPAAPTHPSRKMEPGVDATVSELIALEGRNAELLAVKRHQRQAESERVALTLRDLHGVRRAYGSSRGPHWQSYS